MNRSNVEEIKARLPIEEVVGSYLKLDKAGRSYKARCPFHNEKSPSFFVNPERGGYYCFGCGAKGDIFTFVEQFEGLDFRGALKVLAEKAGVELKSNPKADSERDVLYEIMEQAAAYFEEQYLNSKVAIEYVKSRGILPTTRAEFRIGFAPEGWQNLHDFLRKKGWNDTQLEKAGLIKAKADDSGRGGEVILTRLERSVPSSRQSDRPASDAKQSRFYDRFRGRVMFPITDSSGRVIAFTGRILKDDGQSAKYLNSPDTPLFDKSNVLFGLDKAKSEIRRLNYSILVEGQMDLVLSHQAGVKNCVAASGTALTETNSSAGTVSNLTLLRRLSTNLILALDADSAGRRATMRAVATTALSMGMSVKIAVIKGGKDPADLILANPEDWKHALRSATHVVEYELANVLEDNEDRHTLGKALRERVFPFLGRIDSELDKAFFVRLISEKTALAEVAVWEDLKKVEKSLKVSTSSISGGDGAVTLTRLERSVPSSRQSDRPVSAGEKLSANNKLHRLDLVERRLFGLLNLMERADTATGAVYRKEIETISGPTYALRLATVAPILSDLSFEAETFFGTDPKGWERHMRELLLNFEEDIIAEELVATMQKLRAAEQAKDGPLLATLARKCQELSLKKSEVSKKRRI